jgi:peptide/nickel transport system substrate-binding protein
MRTTGRKYLALTVLLLLVTTLLLPGCGRRAAVEPVTVVVAQGADAVSLDPHKTNDLPSARIMKQLYDTLLFQDENMAIQPGLATAWRQLDELTWEFTLRRGVKFHNGEQFTASDVKFTFERLLNPETKSPAAFILEPLAGVEVVDDHTVRITTLQPFAPILSHLAHSATAILNEKAVTAAGADYGVKPVGTGAFTFSAWTPGSTVELTANKAYWGGAPKIDKLVFSNIPEGATRAVELETGSVDIAYDIESHDVDRLAGNAKLQLVRKPTLATNYIGFNLKKAPFDRLEVRQAINYAVNVEEIIKYVLLNIGTRAVGPIGPNVFGAHPALDGYEYNPERARELLAAAGLTDGFKTTLRTNDNPVRIRIAEVVQAQLKEVGIEVTIEVMEWGAYLERTAAGEHEMFIMGWGSVTGDADYGLYSPFHSSQFGGAGNLTFFANSRVDELLDLGRTSADEQERLAAYHEVQEIITREAPWLFLNVREEVVGMGAGISGFVFHPAGHHALRAVEKK